MIPSDVTTKLTKTNYLKKITKMQDNGFSYTGLLQGRYDTSYSSQSAISSIQVTYTRLVIWENKNRDVPFQKKFGKYGFSYCISYKLLTKIWHDR